MPSANKTPNIGLNQWQGNEYAKRQDFVDDNALIDAKIGELKEAVQNVKVPVTSVNNKTGAVVLNAGDVGAETPSGAQAKANNALTSAKSYTDGLIGTLSSLATTVKTNIVAAINELKNTLDNKVDKISGKGLSTNDYTTTEKNKLAGIEAGAQVNAVTCVAGKTGAVTISKSDVGLPKVDDVKQMPIGGGTFTGIATAHSNTSYTVRQMRNIILSPNDADVSAMQDGDIWIKYK